MVCILVSLKEMFLYCYLILRINIKIAPCEIPLHKLLLQILSIRLYDDAKKKFFLKLMPLKGLFSMRKWLVYFLLLENKHYLIYFFFALAPRKLIPKFWAQLLRLFLCVKLISHIYLGFNISHLNPFWNYKGHI